MANFTSVVLVGNLTKDPETRSAGASSVVHFSMAVNRRTGSGDGKKEEVSFFDVEAWGKTGEVVAKFMTKGRPLLVRGRLKQDRWQTPEGQQRSKIKIVAEEVQFLDKKADGVGGAGGEGESAEAPAATAAESWNDPNASF